MCGILGYISNPKCDDHAEIILGLTKSIFAKSVVRGGHASGFAALHRDGKLTTDKRAVASPRFVQTSRAFRGLDRGNFPNIFIGHTRRATSGEPKIGRNNHPFHTNRWSLVHNGTISGWERVASEHNFRIRSQTDSEVLVHLLDSQDEIGNGFQHMMGTVPYASAMAIAAIDRDASQLGLARNLDRPIAVVFSRTLNTMFFASTENILQDAFSSAFGAKAEFAIKKLDVSMSSVPEWELHVFGIDEDSGLTSLLNKKEILTPTVWRDRRDEEDADDSDVEETPILLPAPRDTTVLTPSKKTEHKIPVDESFTSKLMSDSVSPDTKQRCTELAFAINESRDAMRSLKSDVPGPKFLAYLEKYSRKY